MRKVYLELGKQQSLLVTLLDASHGRILAKSVKIPGEVKTDFFGSVCPLSVASTKRVKLLLQACI